MTKTSTDSMKQGGSAQDDLAYIKAIAEEGRNTPLIGGKGFLIWGAIIGTTALISFLMTVGIVPALPTMWLWSAALGLGWGATFFYVRHDRGRPGASSVSNRTVGAAWKACGITITAYWLSLVVAMLIDEPGGFEVGFLFATMFPVAFGLYALAFYVTAEVAHLPWFRWIAVASWVVAAMLILSVALLPVAYMLIAAIGTFGVVFIPGILMVRGEPSDIV